VTAGLAEIVYRQYSKPLYRYLMRRLANAQNAQELAHETYLRLLRVEDAGLIRAPQAYLFRIASNLVYELHKKQACEVVKFNSQLIERAPDFEQLSVDDALDQQRQVNAMLAALPPLYATILVMKKRDGKSAKEIARELRISIHTVKKYLFQAVAQIRACLTQ
jgi:RNA polymerase sigma-70 factor (ECF subfamily)